MHFTRFITASFWYCLCALHHERTAELALLSCGTRFNNESAFRIIRTTKEWPKASTALYYLATTIGTFHTRLPLLFFFWTLLYIMTAIFTTLPITARNKFSEFSLALKKFSSAFWTQFSRFLWAFHN